MLMLITIYLVKGPRGGNAKYIIKILDELISDISKDMNVNITYKYSRSRKQEGSKTLSVISWTKK